MATAQDFATLERVKESRTEPTASKMFEDVPHGTTVQTHGSHSRHSPAWLDVNADATTLIQPSIHVSCTWLEPRLLPDLLLDMMAHSDAPPPSYEASQSSARFSVDAQQQQQQQQRLEGLPPYHDWQEAVPDTSIFSPPPIAGYYCSGAGNASSDDAQRAHGFCDNTPLWLPERPSPAVYSSVREHDVRPVQQREFVGELAPSARGQWQGRTVDQNGDCLVLTHLPLYFAAEDSPFISEKRKMIYFEVKLLGLRAGSGSDSSGLSIGFVAGPYPSWRSPGWERGSLGVFSDDGCRFVNDSWGGRGFTAPINVGETIGLGMVFTHPENPLALADALFEGRRKCQVEVFFTRNGQRAGGWNLHEETDEESGGIEGLEGDFDLYGALGLFGGVDFEANFNPAAWLWRADE